MKGLLTLAMKKLHYDVWMGVILLLFVGWAYYQTTLFRQADKTAVYPRFLLTVLAALSIILLIGGIRKSRKSQADHLDWSNMKMSLVSAFIVIAYEILFITVGYFIATPIFLITLFTYLKEKNWKIMLTVIAVYLVLVYMIFVKILMIPLI